MEYSSQNKKRFSVTTIQIAVFTIVLGTGIQFTLTRYRGSAFQNMGNVALSNEQKMLTNEIGQFLILPSEEAPTIATVTDKDKLKKQPLFKDAENGDKLLVYKDTKRLILYRPSKQMIITIASIYGEAKDN